MNNNDKPKIIESMDIESVSFMSDGTTGIRGTVNEAIQKGDTEGAMVTHASAPHPYLDKKIEDMSTNELEQRVLALLSTEDMLKELANRELNREDEVDVFKSMHSESEYKIKIDGEVKENDQGLVTILVIRHKSTTCDKCGGDYEEVSGWCKCTRPIKVECQCTCCKSTYADWIETDCVGTERPVQTLCIDCACPATPCNHPPYKEE